MSAAAFHDAALGHVRAERYLDAQLCCQQAIAADPNHADSLHLMGVLALHAKQHDHAVEWITRALRVAAKPSYLLSLGTTMHQQERYQEALATFDTAVQLEPNDAELWINRGNTLLVLQRMVDAAQSFQRVLDLTPHRWEAANACGMIFFQLRRFEEALRYLNLSDELHPNRALTLQTRARALRELKRLDEAHADGLRAYSLDPQNADTRNNIGDMLLQMPAREEAALEWFDKALEVRPDFIEALNNKGCALGKLHRLDQAFASYRQAKAFDPKHAVTDWNLALLHLLTGDFAAGWSGREVRWQIPSLTSAYPKFNQPMWLGAENIEGKTIAVCSDEGLGDVIQFARYVPMMAARGARIILMVPSPLHSLLARLPGVVRCLPPSATGALPHFDMHCPLSSLPLAFGTRLDTIPKAASYLPAPDESLVRAWEDRLRSHFGSNSRLRVGLVWSGNPDHGNDHNRSIQLQAFSRVLDVDANFVSLQKDPRPDDKAFLSGHSGILNPGIHLTDFAETAALVRCLDLVITVDTSVAHLAGALGKPTWVLLPYMPDWRWLLDRDDSPWYPTMRLFRQTESREYRSVLNRVQNELLALIAARRLS